MNILAVLLALIIILVIMIIFFPVKKTKTSLKQTTCSASSCGAIDDVNEPAYNVKETLMNTLLLEQHLSDKKKYCKSCIIKHMLINCAYLSEAIQMACDHCKDYPKLEESLTLHQDILKAWQNKMDDDQVRLQTLTKLRDWRREMIELYYFESAGERS